MKKILKVTEVTLEILKKNPPILVITSKGNVSSGGWSNGQLIRFEYINSPADGIYEFDFVADEPTGPATTVISDITAKTYSWDDFPKELKGVKIYTSSNFKTKKIQTSTLTDTKQQNIGEWRALIKNEGKTPQIIVSGSFPTKGHKPGYHLIKKSDSDKELSLTLVFGRLVDEQGHVNFHTSYSEAIGNDDQYESVSIYDDSDTPRLLASINININRLSFIEDNPAFTPYLEIIKGIQIYSNSLKIRVPSNGLTDHSSFNITINKGITGLPPYWLEIYRIKPDYGKMLVPNGVELEFSFDELDLDPFSTFILINNLG